MRWAQLRVGLTVLFASVMLGVLIFLMSGSTGLFVPRIKLKSYFADASGLRVGAPVRLQSVDIGNVLGLHIVPDRPQTPVEVVMRVSTRYKFALHEDSTASLETAGVLGETYINISSIGAKGPLVREGDVLPTLEQPDIVDVMRTSQSTLADMSVLLTRADRILSFMESGQGSIGKLIYDEQLYKQLSSSVSELQQIVSQVNSGEGSIGKLIASDELYNKANAAIDKLNGLVDNIESGQGTMGKLVKDPALYDNANQTIARANQLLADINTGKGALGKFARDEQFARKLDDTVTRISELADKLNSGQGSAGKFVNDPALYDNANKMLAQTRELLEALRHNPKKYLTIRLHIF